MYTDHMVSMLCIDSYGYSSKDPAESKRYRKLTSTNTSDEPWSTTFRRAVKDGSLTAADIGPVQTVVDACMNAIERVANDPKEQLGKTANYMAQRLNSGMYSPLATPTSLFPLLFPYYGALLDAILEKYFKDVDSLQIVRSLVDMTENTPAVVLINVLETEKPYDKNLIDFAKAYTKKLTKHVDSVMTAKAAFMKYDPANDPNLTYLADNFVNTNGNTGNTRLNIQSSTTARHRMEALGLSNGIILDTEIRIFELACENTNTDTPDATIVQPINGNTLIEFFKSIDAQSCSADQLRKILKALELPKVAALHKKIVAEKWNGVRGKDSAYSEFVITIVRTLAKTDAALIDKFFEDLNDNNTEWKVKNAMVGAEALTTSIEKDVINPFTKVDQKTLNMVLKFNNLTFEQVASKSGLKLRKQTGEKFGSYMKRVADAIEASKGSLGLESLKVAPLARTPKELNKLTVQFTESYHSGGKHGNCYVKILREFDVHLPSKQYDEYMTALKTQAPHQPELQNEIRPAFHGTGGLAAMMILRYGFAVIKPTPGFTVGRMLGDGIYFSNTIDKTAQYVGNGGFTRKAGIKGYMFDMRNLLGPHDPRNQLDVGYRSAGVGADAATRSPEWCVRNPQRQLKIFKCYEVQLIERYDYDNIKRSLLVEDFSDTKMTFKDFLLTEADEGADPIYTEPHQARFTFWDGEIPIMDPKTREISFHGFDEMPEGVLPPNAMIELSGNGPMVVFNDAKETVGYDIFTGRSISGEISREYFDYSMKGFER
jgi:hypothetical protein